MGSVTQPKIYENRLFWIPDPAQPTPRHPDDLTSSVAASPSSVPASAVNTPPSEAHPRLPRRLRPRRRRKRQPAAAANENSSRWASSVATRLRSTANRNSPIPGNQPGIGHPMRSTPGAFPKLHLPFAVTASPFQQPIEIQIARLAWTTLKSGGYINRPGMTPDRI